MNEQEEKVIDDKIADLKKKIAKAIDDLKNYDSITSSSKDFVTLMKDIEIMTDEVDDLINEIEVEDFLLHGSGLKRK